MNPNAPTLPELQRMMREHLLQRGSGEAAVYVVADGLDPGERLNIYANTSASALMKALQLSFPAVQHIVGAEFFEGAARLFADQAPPSSAWLDEYGADFPGFLEQLPQAASLPYLPDVARLEWQVNLVLHAPDAKPLEIARLAQLDGGELAQMRFKPHPAARLLRCHFPADIIWHAVLEQDDRAMAAIDLVDEPVWLLVHRTDSGIDVLRLTESEWDVTAALFCGQPLHEALEKSPCADAQALLAAHLVRGCFMDFDSPRALFEPRIRKIR